MKARHAFLAILITVSATARAQVAPAATGPGGLAVSGTLHYDLRYTQTAQFYGGAGGDAVMSAASGDVTYANANAVHPLALTYSGGDMWYISGRSGSSEVYQHLLVSQGIIKRAWSFNISDDVSYMPQAPANGFSGIPGVGNLPGTPSVPSQTILTLNTRSVNNMVSPNFSRSLDHATSLSVSGSYETLRYPDGNGMEINSVSAGPQISRRLNALNSISGQYSYSHISYPAYSSFTMGTQSAMFGYQRTWSRRLTTSVSAGPQWVQSSNSNLPSSVSRVPASTNLSVNASASYQAGRTSATLSYFQGVNGGSGVSTQIGAHNQDLNASLSRPFGRNLSISATGAYMRTKGLNQAGVTNGEYGGVAATRQLGRYISVFANYTAIQQSSSSVLTANAISGLSQVIGFGIGYSPREIHFRK
jgi:hypothetical protein